MLKKYPKRFTGEYPSSDDALKRALVSVPTKQDKEDEWIAKNVQNPQTRLRARQLLELMNALDINMPAVLWTIVAEYAIVPTWLDVDDTVPPPRAPDSIMHSDLGLD